MKKLLMLVMMLVMILVVGCSNSGESSEEDNCTNEIPQYGVGPDGSVDYKPVIYLYPEEEMEVSVKLDYNGRFTSTYPPYNNGWKVMAKPDGTLYSLENDREYYCLFWEGVSNVEYDFSKGFVVPGNETEAFLEEKLALLGLTDKEANEFIIYWLPQMEGNEYNLISFQDDVYTENAKLEVSPTPDTVIRVFMAWQKLDEPIDVETQELKGVERNGFTVVEWGGSEVNGEND